MRGQLAGQSACIRREGTATTTIGVRHINFSSIALSDTSVSGVLNVRRASYSVGSGFKWIAPRPIEWFELYSFNNPVPDSGPPESWAQFLQGSSGGGAITNSGAGSISTGLLEFDPLPDLAYTIDLDCVCYPAALSTDSDAEAIPYQWTDAVPFGAAWMALLSSQTAARTADAERYFGYFNQYVQRARDSSNPDVLKYQYERQQNITLPNQVGINPSGGQ
jgi:hypothetical protein